VLINGGCEICVIREEVTCELNIGSKLAEIKMITANGKRLDLMKVAKSGPVNSHGIISSVCIIVAKSGSKQDILDHP